MNPTARLLAVVLLAGCPPKTAPPAAAVHTHPDLKCPPGTSPAGGPPPYGLEVWCNRTDAGGRVFREGPSITFHANERKAAEGSWTSDRQDGPWLYWYPTGGPEQQGSFKLGVKEGVWTTYSADGERTSEGAFVDGKEHGAWVFWNADALTRTEGEYVLGARDGVWLDYGPDDKPVRERIYRDGRMVSQREL